MKKGFFDREKIYIFWAIGLSIVGCFMLIAALYMNPMGIIDPSVISAAGTVFLFAGSIVGIRGSFDTKLAKFETEMKKKRLTATEEVEETVEEEKVE